MARIVRFAQNGGPEVLRLVDEVPAAPGAGEIRLKVEAIGLNRAEVMFRSGLYLEEPQFPSRLGYEAAGIVDAVGPDVAGFKIGDRVSTLPAFSIGRYGVYGDSAIVPAHAALACPDTLSFPQAASIWMQYVTAWGALVHHGRVGPSDIVVVTAAASSAGLAAIQVARDHGATVVATTRTPDKRERLLECGADHVVVTASERIADRIRAIGDGRGATLVFDAVGGPLMEDIMDATAPGGTIIEYGFLAGAPTPYPAFPAVAKGLTVRGYTLFEICNAPDLLERCLDYVRDGLAEHRLVPVIDRIFPLAQIVEAHRYMEASAQVGKIVVVPWPQGWHPC